MFISHLEQFILQCRATTETFCFDDDTINNIYKNENFWFYFFFVLFFPPSRIFFIFFCAAVFALVLALFVVFIKIVYFSCFSCFFFRVRVYEFLRWTFGVRLKQIMVCVLCYCCCYFLFFYFIPLKETKPYEAGVDIHF